ncbi:uncharacterized protein LOC121408901 isoform X1 [Lytechinus variegatus]|uniref:uncharacterized protein LOC121408901 isoform X1 n=2 Tax=Lytechinus variegatus TaxID=7654 RepID=UPI001BB29E30|nr:uncharacterized protein LOC121408901 isoform X1 [Lytechinus variegatus]
MPACACAEAGRHIILRSRASWSKAIEIHCPTDLIFRSILQFGLDTHLEVHATMPLSVRVCSADRSIRKYLPIDPEDTVGFFELIKRKFHIKDGEDLVLVDEQEGFGIDDDVLGDVVTSHPSVSLMVLKEDEEWSGSDVHSFTSADNIKVDTSSSSLSSSESDSSFGICRKRPRLDAL